MLIEPLLRFSFGSRIARRTCATRNKNDVDAIKVIFKSQNVSFKLLNILICLNDVQCSLMYDLQKRSPKLCQNYQLFILQILEKLRSFKIENIEPLMAISLYLSPAADSLLLPWLPSSAAELDWTVTTCSERKKEYTSPPILYEKNASCEVR